MGAYVVSDKSTYKVAAGASIKSRDQVSINSSGYAVAAPAPDDGVTGTVVGSSIEDVDNSTGADGAKSVTAEHSLCQRAFLFSGVGITDGDAGKTCYVGANPKQVTKTSTDAVTAGTIQGVDADGRVRVILPL